MSSDDLRLGALGLLALALAAILGWSRPLPEPGVAVAARKQLWTPLDWAPSDGLAAARFLAQSNTFGRPDMRAGVAAGVPESSRSTTVPMPAQIGPWRIVGTADWGEGLSAIVQMQPPGTPRPKFLFLRPRGEPARRTDGDPGRACAGRSWPP